MKKARVRLLPISLTAAMASTSTFASYTRYDFSFETDNTITASGYFTIDDSWVAKGTYQAVSDFAGSLAPNSQSSIITGGAFTNLTVRNLNTLLFRFVSGDITYTANFGGGSIFNTGFELSYNPSGSTMTITEIYNPYSIPSRPAPLNDVTPISTPSNDAPPISAPLDEVTPISAPSNDVTPISQVPEIDGDKLPQAALLVVGLFLAYRSRKLLKSTGNSIMQMA